METPLQVIETLLASALTLLDKEKTLPPWVADDVQAALERVREADDAQVHNETTPASGNAR